MDQVGKLPGLEGKTGLVVGGGLGIGRATARALAEQGVRLAVVDREKDRVAAMSDELDAYGICADVLEEGRARLAVDEAYRELRAVDILVNTVGKGMAIPGADIRAGAQRSVLEMNYLHHVEFCSAFAQKAIQAGTAGVITMVSSLAGVTPFPGQGAYGAAKSALNSYAASLAVELAPHQIRVNTVAPGIVRTDRNSWEGEEGRRFLKAIPLGRFADQSEIASVILFLSSAMASYVTGQSIVLDGAASHYLKLWDR
jgi:NAD(P)-dependent dehydrogenase (short-subunit alcohol dehydrogenase family)